MARRPAPRPGQRPLRQVRRPDPADDAGARAPRRPRGRFRVGERFEVEVGPVAHGGHFVARLPEPDNRVVFVRHALPGERSSSRSPTAPRATSSGAADAVEVLSPPRTGSRHPAASPAPMPCGGCDFQHVALARQRELKADVVREQLRRLAGLEVVRGGRDRCPATTTGLRWRTRQQLRRSCPAGRIGMRKHRSHDVVEIDECLLESPVAPVVRRARRRSLRQVAADGLLAGAPGRAGDAGRRRARRPRPAAGRAGPGPVRRRRAVRPVPRRAGGGVGAGGRGRGRPDRGRPRARQPGRPPGRRGDGRSGRGGAVQVATTSRSTWSCSTRRARARSGRWWSRWWPASPRAVAYVACDPARPGPGRRDLRRARVSSSTRSGPSTCSR